MTSVKEVRTDTPPTSAALGTGSFYFTDDYSVFDWGRMPDPIPEKGAVLCTMGASNFERLEANGILTHYRGVRTDGKTGDLAGVPVPPREMLIELTQVPRLPFTDGAYDYTAYHAEAGDNYLVPLEIVFRNVVPVGSSLRTRVSPNELGFSFDAWPDRAVTLEEPVIEFSTKYEEQDRYLTDAEADSIAGRASIDSLKALARDVNTVITQRATETGLTHQDGKIECLYCQGEIRVADVVGTFDENRFSYDGQQLSKEVIRQYYKQTHPEWVAAMGEAKATANERGVADWRSLCPERPPPLPSHVITTVSDLYTAGANTYLDEQLFDAPSLDRVIESVRGLLS